MSLRKTCLYVSDFNNTEGHQIAANRKLKNEFVGLPRTCFLEI